MSKKDEKLEVLRDVIVIRKKITNVLRVLFLQAQKRSENLKASLAATTTDAETLAAKEAIREETFNAWLIRQSCEKIATQCVELVSNLRTANTIWPTYMAEYLERRLCMDRALGTCNALQSELQFIAEEVYADKNKFTPLALEIEAVFLKIKGLRQADNRFLRKLKDDNQKV